MKKIGFILWLKKQHKRDDIVGDLSRDLLLDTELVRTYNGLKKRMHRAPWTCSGAYEALEEAYIEYKKI